MSQPIKILIFTPWFSPAFRAGGPIQSIINLVHSFKKNVAYYIITSNTDLNGELLEVEPDKWIDYNEITRVKYLDRHNRTERIKAEAEAIEAEVLFIIGIYDPHFNLFPLRNIKAKRKVISVRGMLFPEALKLKPFKKKIYFLLWKLLNWHKGSVFHATNEAEKDTVTKMFGNNVQVKIAANFPRLFSLMPVMPKKPDSLVMVSVALISPMKNHHLVLEALMSCNAHVTYHIYGPVKDAAYWEVCKSMIKVMPANIDVQVHGEIAPNEVQQALAQSHIFILPSKSENYGHSLIEALSAGRPVITGNFTPWNKLEENKAGFNVNLKPADILNAVNQFASMQEAEMSEWAKGAVAYAQKEVNLSELEIQYEQLFEM